VQQLGDRLAERPGVGVGGHLLGVEAAADQDRHQVADQRGGGRRVVGVEGPEEGGAGPVGDAGGPPGLGLVAPAGGLEPGEHRRPRFVQRHEPTDPLGEVRDAVAVRRHPLELVGVGDHVPAQLGGERPEHVVLAGEVLVEGRARAAGAGGDQLDAGLGEADLCEAVEGRAEDATPGVRAPHAHQRVAPEGRAPHGARVHGRVI
jgi:hypothetical protein